VAELRIADVREQLALSIVTDFENYSVFTPKDAHEEKLHRAFDQVVNWAQALATVRVAPGCQPGATMPSDRATDRDCRPA
jgi:hypothetical protein